MAVQSKTEFFTSWAKACGEPLTMDSTGKVSVNHANYSPALVQDIQGVQNKQDIHDAKGISAVSRLHAYRLQYWFRLITLLQKEFPTTVIVMGLVPFNAMAQQYIAAYPCAPGCLSRIANQFVAYSSVYLNTNARQNIKVDGEIVRQAVALDWAYHEVFIEREHFEEHTHWVHVSQESLTQLMQGQGQLALHPCVDILQLDYDLVSIRHHTQRHQGTQGTAIVYSQLLKPFAQTKYYVIYRSNTHIYLSELPPHAGIFLRNIKQGVPWEQALQHVETPAEESVMALFFKQAIQKQWLVARVFQ